MQKIFPSFLNLKKALVTAVRTTVNSQPADYIRTNLHNGVGRYMCQMQRVTFKFCKESPTSRGIRYNLKVYFQVRGFDRSHRPIFSLIAQK